MPPSFWRASDIDPEELKKRSLDRALLRRSWTFVRPYRRKLGVYLAVIALSSLVGVLPPLVFRRLIDTAIPTRDLGAVNLLALAAVGLALTAAAMSFVMRWLGSVIGEGIIYDLRAALYDHVQRMPIAFFTRTQTGSLLSRLNNDVVGAQQAVSTLSNVLSDGLTLTFTLVAMFALDWRVTALALLVGPLFLLVSHRVGRRMQYIVRRRMELTASMNTTMTERFNVSGALLVKLFGRPRDEAQEFSRRAADVRDIGIRWAIVARTLFVALSLITALGTAAVYWFGARSVISGGLTIGTVVAFAAYITRLYEPLTDLANARIDVISALVSFERVFEVLDAPRAIDDVAGAVELRSSTGRVELDDVWFRYPASADVSIASLEAEGATPLSGEASAWVLRGVSLTAEPGTMTALVGPSGAGKTTLSSLVPRLYDVTAGSVRVDGHDVRDLTLDSLTASIGMVTQDAHLFHDTVAANLRYARMDATDDELIAAARAARIHDVIAALPEGYDTLVGERGYRLSGGEKQRLAIARVLLKDPAIVILDEATAHLDSETEVLIQQALAEALDGRTSVVIAHRLSTIRAADQILVLDGGAIVERGRHDELLARGGLYADLYETQYAPSGVAA
jgi:ATP-binding cassette subfamily B protein